MTSHAVSLIFILRCYERAERQCISMSISQGLFTKRPQQKLPFSDIFTTNKGLNAQWRPLPTPPRGRDLRLHTPLRALRLFKNTKLRGFLTVVLRSKSGFRRAMGPLRHRNNGLLAMQRRPRCNAIRASLQPRGAAFATSPRLYQKTGR